MEQLAGEIFTCRRSAVLERIWGQQFGNLGVLRRLPGRILLRRHYDQLVAVLADPKKRELLFQRARMAATDLEIIARYDDSDAAAAVLRKAALIRPELLDYAITAVRRLRPDLTQTGLTAALCDLAQARSLSHWLRALLEHAQIPPPPWEGTASIIPLRSAAEIRAAGVEFRNCLRDDEPWLAALLGSRAYYVFRSRKGPAVAAAVFDSLIGSWRLESLQGPANAPVPSATARQIRKAFAAAGIGYYGDWPYSRALDVADPTFPGW
jgi:hypothetical protein